MRPRSGSRAEGRGACPVRSHSLRTHLAQPPPPNPHAPRITMDVYKHHHLRFMHWAGWLTCCYQQALWRPHRRPGAGLVVFCEQRACLTSCVMLLLHTKQADGQPIQPNMPMALGMSAHMPCQALPCVRRTYKSTLRLLLSFICGSECSARAGGYANNSQLVIAARCT